MENDLIFISLNGKKKHGRKNKKDGEGKQEKMKKYGSEKHLVLQEKWV